MFRESKDPKTTVATLRGAVACLVVFLLFSLGARVDAAARDGGSETSASAASAEGTVSLANAKVGDDTPNRVVVVRLEGLPASKADGSSRRAEDLPVVAWEARAPDGTRRASVTPCSDSEARLELSGELRGAKELVLLSASAGGSRFRPVAGRERLSLQEGAELVAWFEAAPRTSLVVKDAETGGPVDGWELLLHGGHEPAGTFRKSVIEPIYARLRDAVSFGVAPVELESLVPAVLGQGGRVDWRVRATGFADCRISVALGSGGTHELLLRRCASANVRWQVPDALLALARDGQLRLALLLDPADPYAATDELSGAALPLAAVQVHPAPDFESFTPAFGTDERGPCYRITLTGLPAGEHELRLDRKRVGLVERRELASARFVATPGQRALVELETSSGALELPSTLSFDFVVPAEYGDVLRSTLTLQRVVERKPGRSRTEVELDSRAGRSAPVTLSAGSYELVLSGGLNFRTRIEVGAGVSERRRIELPPLTRFQVRLVAESGGDAGLPEAFPWSACFGNNLSRDFIAICEKGKPGTFELLSQSDEIELRPPREGSIRFASGATARLSGGGEHVVAVHRSPRVRLQLVRDGRRIAIPLGLRVVQRYCVDPPRGPTDNPPPQRVIRPAPGAPEELQLWFPGPGTYELQLSPLEGYAPLPRLRVRVAEHDDLAVEVPLEPRN